MLITIDVFKLNVQKFQMVKFTLLEFQKLIIKYYIGLKKMTTHLSRGHKSYDSKLME